MTVMSVLVIKLVPMACDLGASYLLYRVGRESWETVLRRYWLH